LVLSVLVKLWMWSYNRFLAKKIDSKVLKGASSDSLNDVISTSAVILCSLVGYYLDINIDGYIGCVVSVLVMLVGFNLARDTINILLGSAPSEEMIKSLEKLICESSYVLGIHDLIVHDYGPGRVFSSVHAEVSDTEDVVKIHEEIDLIEQRAKNEYGIELVIHMDPIATNCEKLNAARNMMLSIISSIGPYTMHDFRMTDGENRINLIFDMVVPARLSEKEREGLILAVSERVQEIDERYVAVIQIDNDYTGQIAD